MRTDYQLYVGELLGMKNTACGSQGAPGWRRNWIHEQAVGGVLGVSLRCYGDISQGTYLSLAG